MPLHFHLGGSGSGKSTGLYNLIIKESMADFSTTYLCIVPEQFTLQTQRDIIAMHPDKGIMNIDVLSFMRLAYRVFEELGYKQPQVLEDTGKSMIVKKVALDKRDELRLYGGKVHQQGFIEEMKSVISEFYQYGVGERELAQMEELCGRRRQLSAKLSDIRTVFNGFREFIEGRFIMNEQLLDKLCEKAEESELLKNCVICFDGFTGFTASQYALLECLMRMVKDIHITLTIDEREIHRAQNENSLFYLSYKTIMRCTALAEKCRLEIREHVYGGVPYRFKNNKALAALEHGIFRYPVRESGGSGVVRILSCDSRRAELLRVIAEINRLVIEEGYRYRDIAVVSGEIENYGRMADREFTRAGIPFFLDEKRNILGTAPVEMLRAVLEIAETDYTYESVFRFLKSGLAPVSEDEISILENYCLEFGIRGCGRWNREWTTPCRGRHKADIAAVNGIRERINGLIGDVCQVLRTKTTVKERMTALYELLVRCGVQEKLEAEAERKLLSADISERLEAKSEEQLFGIVIDVFDRITSLLGDDIISGKEFCEILDTGFREAKLRVIPQGADSVVIGDIERTRLNNIKIMFLIGANDGVIPKTGASGGILSDDERRIFEENDIELSPTKRQSAYLSEFYLYLCLTKPCDGIFVSFHRRDKDNKPARPSYLIGKLKKIFPDVVTEVYSSKKPESIGMLLGADKGLGSLAAIMREKRVDELSAEEQTLISVYRNEAREIYERVIAAAFYRPVDERLDENVGKSLYGNVLKGSVTRLEKYAACAYAHFLRYGLMLEERSEYKIGSVDIGNIYHKAIELYGEALKQRGLSWHDADEAVRQELKSEVLLTAVSDYEEIFGSSKRNEYMITRLDRVLDRTLSVLDAQVKAGSFEPEFYEESFLHANAYMELRGKIDRLDLCRRKEGWYLRVIDYKSGNSDFDLNKLYHGLQIQLAVYMKESMRLVAKDEAAENIIPAGLFYYNINDPIIERNEMKQDTMERRLRLSGPSNSSMEAMKLHDSSFEGDGEGLKPSVKSKVIQAETDKSGAVGARSKIMTDEQFIAMSEYVDELTEREGREILKGNAAVNPYRLGDMTACDYCPYGTVCSFDCRLGSSYRELAKCQEDDIWRQIDGQMNKEA